MVHSSPNDSKSGSPGLHRWIDRFFAPIDIASVVYFRISFGALMVWELWRYLVDHRVNSLWIEPDFHFKYFGFEWVHRPPGHWMYALFVLVLSSAVGVTLGWWYRVCAAIFAIGFTWLFLIDQAKYLNHFYLICLLGFVSVLLPANRRCALDSVRKPALRSDIAPAWTLWLLRAQVAIVYFYGGLAKLNADWLHGEPVRTWLTRRAEHFGDWLRSEWTVGLVSYGGLLFDLFIVPLLLWRRTRLFAFLLAAAFHLTNNWLFSIGVFPWLSIAMTALFFPPDWPRRFVIHVQELWPSRTPGKSRVLLNAEQIGFQQRRWIVAFLGVYLGWQVLMPLRHHLYPGAASWTEEGHRFSWHMMLRSKTAETKFFVFDPTTQEVWALDPLAYLTLRQYEKMTGRPDMILQFAHHIAALMQERAGRTNIQIHAIAKASLNGRKPALLIDPDVNLAAVQRDLRPASWILPLDNNRSTPAWLQPAPTPIPAQPGPH